MAYQIIKCGGSVLDQLPESFYQEVITLIEDYQAQPVIVHGGGPMVSSLLTDLNIETKFVNGMRITTEEVLDVVEMVLSGTINKKLVRAIVENGGEAFGLSGVDGKLLLARAIQSKQQLGYVGEVVSVNTTPLKMVLEQGKIPVISPVAIDETGQRWNINADLAAAAVAKALKAPLYMVTNVPGVLKDGSVISELTANEAEKMIAAGQIYGGMIPKVQAAIDCLREGVQKVAIINGQEEKSLIKQVTGKNAGTLFALDKAVKTPANLSAGRV